ncbi:MAG: ABC transporter permease [Chloroflexi bacterium]|nr:ABC transporter permease [Chloroflexota bacterium]
MQTFFNVARTELRLIFQSRAQLVNMFVISPILALVVGLGTGAITGGFSETPRLRVDWIDRDQSDLSTAFAAQLRTANSNLVLCPIDNDEDDVCRLDNRDTLDEDLARERLIDGDSLALIIVPDGFESDLLDGRSVSVTYRSNADLTASDHILETVQAVTQQISGSFVAVAVAPDAVESAEGFEFPDNASRQRYQENVYDVATELWAQDLVQVSFEQTIDVGDEDSQVSTAQIGFGQSIPGMSTMYVMFSIFPAMTALILERENWTLQRLVMTPAPRWHLVGGKIAARFVTGMIQYGILFGVAALLGISFGGDVLALVLVMMGFVFAICGLTLALATLVRSEGQANGISLLLTLTLAPLGGAWWPLDITPQFMQVIGRISPVAWAMDAFQALIFEQGGLLTVLPSVLILTAIGLVFTIIGASRFSYE